MTTLVRLARNEYNNGPVDQVELYIGGLWLRCDVTSEREIRLAKRLADDLDVELMDVRGSQDAMDELTKILEEQISD